MVHNSGGTEACIDAVAIGGFSRMKALEVRHNDSPARASQPFNKDRGGFVIGEGAGVLILEEMDHALLRGAKIYAEVKTSLSLTVTIALASSGKNWAQHVYLHSENRMKQKSFAVACGLRLWAE